MGLIIDAHNHVGGPDRGDGKRQSAEEIVTEMDRLGIDKAVIFPFNEINPGISFSMANKRTAEAINKYPDRLIGFARLDPNFGKKAVEELKRDVEIGLVGLKLHPSSQKFSLRSENLKDIIKNADRLNIPIIFDSGKKESPPEQFGELADLFPDAKIIMAHMLGDFLRVALHHQNIYLQTTGMPRKEIIQEAVEDLGAERIIMGSDSPYISMESELTKIKSLNISENEKKLIMGENMRRILEL
ncbi:MAG: Amidohydrolase [Candidatus Methanoperedens nitroreducens]|uniref:Amidohydrolase n=1 Tax=Candidatus Methanoperedens nitratireducens TaxID=1392998 RepID=A0A0P8E1Y6_9EURY|nr:amidohydrolase family protein [Candidatus Methanoperedens sp. BLZ2]KAB2946951.1 MAG: amidohydrolase [Candidatus Methanoperedens sp.]KPQ44287.1 MAG: Amidohydrolase [Candidatus Methanoperedens sp. BLZ1]MBZ0176750.1 amidohydrolase family protein [Candidatus Methanoperedens nitroreducens]MCX9080471.1 amidohydrolase family protein [Candidatus Methanoperedens sp.]